MLPDEVRKAVDTWAGTYNVTLHAAAKRALVAHLLAREAEVRELVEAALRDAGKVAHLYHNGEGMLWYAKQQLEAALAKFHPTKEKP